MDMKTRFLAVDHRRFAWSAAALAAVLATAPFSAQAADQEAMRIARQLNNAFIDVAEKVAPSVVVITVTSGNKNADSEAPSAELRRFRRFFPGLPEGFEMNNAPRQGQGSGVIVRAEGYIVTNNHVVEGAEEIKVRLKDGRVFDAEVRGAFPDADIAVVKIKEKVDDLPVARFADSEKVRVGEFAIAIGAPFELDYSVTYGHVSAKGRGNLSGGPGEQDFIQTDAAINFGNSGGPLVNLDGEVIGINAMIRGVGTGIGFAIPSNIAHEIGDRIIADGKFTPSYIGAMPQTVRNPGEAAPGVTEGVLIESIMPNSPASKSKLEAGDVVIAVDGKRVSSDSQFRSEIARKAPGKEVFLEVMREGRKITVAVTPQPRTQDVLVAARKRFSAHEAPPSVTDGAALKTMTPEVAEQMGVGFSPGVAVVDVDENSPAARSGLQPHDVITHINGKAVTTAREAREALAQSKKGGARVKYLRDGERQFLFYKPDSE